MKNKIYLIAFLLLGVFVFSQSEKDVRASQTECNKLVDNETSLFKDVCNTSTYKSTFKGNLLLNVQGKDKTIKVKPVKANLIIENDSENVYDCSYKTYACKVNKDLSIHYKTYNFANELSFTYKGKSYTFSTLDGGMDCHIKNLKVAFKKTKKGEAMELSFLDDIFLFGKNGKIQIKKGSFFSFTTSK